MRHPKIYEMAGDGGGVACAGIEERLHPLRTAIDERGPDSRMAEPARFTRPGAQDVPPDVADQVETNQVETIMSRDYILHKVRTALGRSVDQPPPAPPPVRIVVPEVGMEAKIDSFCARLGSAGW